MSRVYGSNWLPVRPFYKPHAWRHLQEIVISGGTRDMCHDLAAEKGNLKSLVIGISNLRGENLQAILVANPGLQVLRMGVSGIQLLDGVLIIGNLI